MHKSPIGQLSGEMWDNELIMDKDQFSLKIKLKQYSENDQKN